MSWHGSKIPLRSKRYSDCRVCNRRRIKCDRRLPGCGKCEKRGLECSGYGLILKWNQGVASRGNLKGKDVPISSMKLVPAKSHLAHLNASEVYGQCQSQEVTSNYGLQIYNLPRTLDSTHLKVADHRRLLYHYDHIVAANMAWADSPENPWRHIIIPLAFKSPPLMSALLAFAAKHIDAITSPSIFEDGVSLELAIPSGYHQQAITLLALEIQEFANVDIPWDRSNAILATMLVLCNVETVFPDSPVWQVHLNAARTVMAARQSETSPRAPEETITSFLEQELFIANTFASTTNFVIPMQDENPRPSISRSGSIFVEFLKLIEMVTILERQAVASPSILSGISLSGLRTLFEHARARIQASHGNDYLHLSRSVNCFYHAGLIYACRALLKSSPTEIERDTQIKTSTVELLRFLKFVEPSKPTFAQDLVWPLFITGTEVTEKREQEMVVIKLQHAMSGTGFSNCQHALEFLKALWLRRDLDNTGNFDWMNFARVWTGQGRTFLVF